MEKQCNLCNKVLTVEAFYKANGYADGYTKRCKSCVKQKARESELLLRSTADGLEKDRKRNRDKYYRLNYKNKKKHLKSYDKRIEYDKKYKEKYPEKLNAKNKSSHLKTKIKGNHLHHWSYNDEHLKDVIELSPKDHNLLHRYLVYDKDRFMYRTLNGKLLNTRESHLSYFEKIKELD